MHRELAAELGAERLGFRPLEVLATAAAEGDDDLERYRRVPSPAWLDGNAVVHEVIGTPATTAQLDPPAFTRALADDAVDRGAELLIGVVDGLVLDGPGGAVSAVSVDGVRRPADVVVLALGPWTPQAQRWLALPHVLGTRWASLTLRADVPAQAVFSEFLDRRGARSAFRIYPRPGGAVHLTGHPEHAPLPADPDAIVPAEASVAELRRIGAVHARALGDAPEIGRSACYRPLTVDGIPLIGPVPGVPGAFLATAHASWGLLQGPATGRMVAEMILDGASRSLDAGPFALTRLPAGRT